MKIALLMDGWKRFFTYAGSAYDKSFECKCGVNGFEKLLGLHGEEDAGCSICASDNITTGGCEMVAKHGFAVLVDF